MKEIDQPTSLNRRSFLKAAGLLIGTWGLSTSSAFGAIDTATLAEDSLFKCKPLVLRAGENSMQLVVVTKEQTACWLSYGTTAKQLDRKTREVRNGMAHVGTIHHFKLTDLSPGQTYHYQVEATLVEKLERKDAVFGTKELTPEASLHAVDPNANEAYCLIYNDIHETPESFGLLRKLVPAAQPDFYVLNGDMVSNMRSEDHFISNVLAPMAALSASSVPVLYSRGNHETWNWYARHITDYLLDDPHPFYYGFRQGPAYFIILDSGEARQDSDPVNWGLIEFDAYREAQALWLQEEVEKPEFKQAKHRIVITHIPPFYASSPIHAATHSFGLWGDILNKSGISVMICGHTHQPKVHPAVAGKHNFPIVIGGGPKEGNRTIISLKAKAQNLHLQLIHESGKLLGEVKR